MRSPTVSVVIPSYNHERFVGEAIDSVRDQTLQDWELIVIDDGSGDGSCEVIGSRARDDDRIKLVRQPNAGAHAAINRGIAMARGEFVAILNSDDRFAPRRLARLHEACTGAAPTDFAVTGVRLIDADSQPIDDPAHWWNAMVASYVAAARDHGVIEGLMFGNFTVSTSNFFFRRVAAAELGPLRRYRYVMDWDYALRAALRAADRFAFLADERLLDYRLHGRNTILGGMPRAALEAAAVERDVLRRHFAVPETLLASQRRHQRLLRKHRSASVAAQRDAHWSPVVADFEQRLIRSTRGWAETRDAWAETRAELQRTGDEFGRTQAELQRTGNELARVRAELARLQGSRSYRLGLALTAPLRWLRRSRARPAESGAAMVRTGPPAERPIRYAKLTAAAMAGPLPPLRIAVHLHLHYHDLLDELAGYVDNIPAPFDLFVTVNESSAALEDTLRQRFANVTVLVVENRGKDVGAFIAALNRFDLERYNLVLKVHSKKSLNLASYIGAVQSLFGSDVVDGAAWRRQLLEPVLGSPEAVGAVLAAFAADPGLGMVGSAKFVCSTPDADAALFASLCKRLGVGPQVLFFAGTMFWIRGEVLARIGRAGFTPEDFDPALRAAVEGTLEHCFERVFGALVADCGYTVGGL